MQTDSKALGLQGNRVMTCGTNTVHVDKLQPRLQSRQQGDAGCESMLRSSASLLGDSGYSAPPAVHPLPLRASPVRHSPFDPLAGVEPTGHPEVEIGVPLQLPSLQMARITEGIGQGRWIWAEAMRVHDIGVFR